jgi:uncharacterized membrane protein YphA (DoxX/SURF4 family)
MFLSKRGGGMDIVRKSETWRDSHQNSKIIMGLRILLGLILVYKGIYFLEHNLDLQRVLSQSKFGFGSMAIAHYIALVHLAGGLMIAAGFLTRFWVALQLPILIGAIVFINNQSSVFNVYRELILSIGVLLVLLFFLFYGAGRYSLDVFLRRKMFYE